MNPPVFRACRRWRRATPACWCWAAFPAPRRWRASSITPIRKMPSGGCCRRSGRRARCRAPNTYHQRVDWLLDKGLGLWDVYASCERQGSLDSAIRQPQVNDLAGLLRHCPALRLIAHNGGESFRHARITRALGLPVYRLPSTSPANASWSFERKLAAWREVVGLAGLL